MNRKLITALSRLAMLIVVLGRCHNASGATADVEPLAHTHAHNDYLHTHPLYDALDQGFTSVEADIFPVDGKLLVGHTRDALKPDRTLESLYLAPLAERVHKNGGHVYSKASRFFLLIDIKRNPQDAYKELQKLFAKYADMLTKFESGKTRSGAITVVLTGYTPQIAFDDAGPRYAGLDGRLSDLGSRTPADRMPMISESWGKRFSWTGKGPMPDKERADLREIVKKAHASGRVVRFWATPESETVWRELRAADVDLINTDQLERLAKYLRSEESRALGPQQSSKK